jgi:cell division protein ZapA
MSEVTLEIGGRPYTVACEEGQESHIEMLGGMIEEKLNAMGQLAPSRSQNLLFAGLFLADDLHEAKKSGGSVAVIQAELEAARSAKSDAANAMQEMQLERDALLSERDTMRSDLEALKSNLTAAEAERDSQSAKAEQLAAQVEQLTQAQDNSPAAPDVTPQLTELAEALEKCATKLEAKVAGP